MRASGLQAMPLRVPSVEQRWASAPVGPEFAASHAAPGLLLLLLELLGAHETDLSRVEPQHLVVVLRRYVHASQSSLSRSWKSSEMSLKVLVSLLKYSLWEVRVSLFAVECEETPVCGRRASGNFAWNVLYRNDLPACVACVNVLHLQKTDLCGRREY